MRVAMAMRTAGAGYVELGSEPPLTVVEANGLPVRKAVSVRWLSGTVLTGFTAIFLMGGALLVALNGQDLLASRPEAVDYGSVGSSSLVSGQKGDRIIQPPPPAPTRETLSVPISTPQADGSSVIRDRPYVLINAALATARAEEGAVPAYDPLRIVGEGAEEDAPVADTGQVSTARVDGGGVSVQTSPFPLGVAYAVATVPTPVIEEIVRGASPALSMGMVRTAALSYATVGALDLESLVSDPFAEPGVRIIPENITFVSKTDSAGNISRDERVVAVARRETLAEALRRIGIGESDVGEAVVAMEGLLDLAALGPTHRVRVAFAPAPIDRPEEGPRPLRVSIYANGVHQATVARTDAGDFVRADEPPPLPEGLEDAEEVVAVGQMPRLYEAIYMTGLEQGVPTPMIDRLVRMFAFSLDMQARIGSGDTITVLHAEPENGAAVDPEQILYAAVTMSGVTTRYYRFQTPDGQVDFYDPDGRSANVFLLRKPLAIGELRSGFGYRVHPILGYRKLHTGVDWTAPRGTPIVASGDGTVVSAGYNSGGYGNYTRIQHANGYETAYAHQTSIAPGIVPGARVRQGQVIGYVGSTGLSTGPHLHYEVRINGQLVDPMDIRLPPGRDLTSDQLAAFQRARNSIDALVAPDTNGPQFAAR